MKYYFEMYLLFAIIKRNFYQIIIKIDMYLKTIKINFIDFFK